MSEQTVCPACDGSGKKAKSKLPPGYIFDGGLKRDPHADFPENPNEMSSQTHTPRLEELYAALLAVQKIENEIMYVASGTGGHLVEDNAANDINIVSRLVEEQR